MINSDEWGPWDDFIMLGTIFSVLGVLSCIAWACIIYEIVQWWIL